MKTAAFDQTFGTFYDSTIAANHPKNGPGMLMKDLNRYQQLAAGLGAVLRIVNANGVMADEHDPQDPGSAPPPPISRTTESLLLAMAAAVCEQMVDSIDARALEYNDRVTQ
jgi:hypothetical protein